MDSWQRGARSHPHETEGSFLGTGGCDGGVVGLLGALHAAIFDGRARGAGSDWRGDGRLGGEVVWTSWVVCWGLEGGVFTGDADGGFYGELVTSGWWLCCLSGRRVATHERLSAS